MKQGVSLETLPQVLRDIERRAPAHVRLAPIVTAEHLTLIKVQLRGVWRSASTLSASGKRSAHVEPELLEGGWRELCRARGWEWMLSVLGDECGAMVYHAGQELGRGRAAEPFLAFTQAVQGALQAVGQTQPSIKPSGAAGRTRCPGTRCPRPASSRVSVLPPP